MYTTCLFCNTDLGRNEAIEALPIGRRLAFDSERGRLWVVCRRCERWNLTAVEERWEALEQCERAFGGTRLRVSTDNIGLARLHEGLELVRVGRALRPEFAAWRYGDQFGRRRRRQIAVTGGALALVGGVVAGGAAAGIGIVSFGGLITQVVQRLVNGNPKQVIARIHSAEGTVEVQRRDLAKTAILASERAPFALRIDREKRGVALLDGADAVRAAGLLFPAANRFGAGRAEVRGAVSLIESAGDPSEYLAGVARGAAITRRKKDWRWDAAEATRQSTGVPFEMIDVVPQKGLLALRSVDRLAIEMALQEESERRAMEGELAELERAWRDAEEIAAISDNLLVSPSIAGALEALKRRAE
jgi:hypothetical protein